MFTSPPRKPPRLFIFGLGGSGAFAAGFEGRLLAGPHPRAHPPATSHSVLPTTPGEETYPHNRYLFTERLFGWRPFRARRAEEEKPFPVIAVTASLRDADGQPLSFQAVSFALQTSFGTLAYGSRPTDDAGKAQLLVLDYRYGKYPLAISYQGDADYQASRAEILVDFGPQPPPTLPPEGVLITPYPTAAIGLPFLVFYGIIWVVFFYAFGYLVLWRMRRTRPR